MLASRYPPLTALKIDLVFGVCNVFYVIFDMYIISYFSL